MKYSTQGNVHARLEYHEYWESNLYINISYNFINLSQGSNQKWGEKREGNCEFKPDQKCVCGGDGGWGGRGVRI